MAKRKIKVGIVGTGGIAKACHIPGWQENKDVEIVAVCDINKKRASSAVEEFNIPNAFKDFKKLVRMKEIDIVDVCTPNMVHMPAVLAALNAGKHVICEKPLAVTTAEVKKMGLTAKKKRRKLMTAQHRWPRAIPLRSEIPPTSSSACQAEVGLLPGREEESELGDYERGRYEKE